MKNIGVLVNTIYSEYEELLWNNIVNHAKTLDYNIVYFVYGGYKENQYSISSLRNIIGQFINSNSIAGLIVFSSSIGFMAGPELVYKFLKSIKDIPIVSIGYAYEDIPSIIIDNKKGMSELIEHLITHHHYKNFAFISGPEKNSDAIERLEITLQVFKKHNIDLDPAKLIYGNFCDNGAVKAISNLLDERKATFDCVICANDQTAISVCRELKLRGYRIPEDIAVTGFDNIGEASIPTAMLSTVSIPFQEIAYQALKMIVALMKEHKVEILHSFASYPILRHSCGCLYAMKGNVIKKSDKHSFTWSHQELVFLLKKELNGLDFIHRDKNIKKKIIEKLAEGILNSKINNSTVPIIQVIEKILLSDTLTLINIFSWQKIFTNLYNYILPLLKKSTDKLFIQNLCLEIQAFFQTFIKADIQSYKINLRSYHYNFNRFSDVISNQYTPDEQKELLNIITLQLHINYFYLAIFHPDNPNLVKLHVIFEKGKYYSYQNGDSIQLFEFIQFCLARINEKKQFLLMPLYTKNIHLGCILIDIGIEDGQFYEILAFRISDYLNSLRLYYQLNDYAQDLEKEVEKRTNDLIKANKLIQNEMLKNKKKANELAIKNSEIKRLNAYLDKKSKTDKLTQLYNRYALYEFLEKEIIIIQKKLKKNKMNKERRYSGIKNCFNSSFSIILIDIDFFKKINDTYGHLFGDKVLKKLGKILTNRSIVREHDKAVRFGGEEFIILLNNTVYTEAKHVAERIQYIIAKTKIRYNKQVATTITVSMGIAEYETTDKRVDSIIDRADAALYYAKHAGRNLICCYAEIKDKI